MTCSSAVPAARVPRRGGLTLVELLVALAVSAIVVLAAGAIVSALIVAHDATQRSARVIGADLATERLLRQLALNVEPSGGGVRYRYVGDTLRLSSWCPTIHGWLERCLVRVASGELLDIRFASHRFSLGRTWRPVGWLFLTAPNIGGTWTDTWTDSLRLPQALGIVRLRAGRRDTIIFRLGERG